MREAWPVGTARPTSILAANPEQATPHKQNKTLIETNEPGSFTLLGTTPISKYGIR